MRAPHPWRRPLGISCRTPRQAPHSCRRLGPSPPHRAHRLPLAPSLTGAQCDRSGWQANLQLCPAGAEPMLHIWRCAPRPPPPPQITAAIASASCRPQKMTLAEIYEFIAAKWCALLLWASHELHHSRRAGRRRRPPGPSPLTRACCGAQAVLQDGGHRVEELNQAQPVAQPQLCQGAAGPGRPGERQLLDGGREGGCFRCPPPPCPRQPADASPPMQAKNDEKKISAQKIVVNELRGLAGPAELTSYFTKRLKKSIPEEEHYALEKSQRAGGA